MRRKRPQLAAQPQRRIRFDPGNWPASDCSVATSPSAANIAILSNRRETTGVWRGWRKCTLRRTAVCFVLTKDLWPRHPQLASPRAALAMRAPADPSLPGPLALLSKLNDIAPNIQRARPVPAIAPQAQQTFGVVPLRACKVPFQHIPQRADGIPRSAKSSACSSCLVLLFRYRNLKRVFDSLQRGSSNKHAP